MSLSRQERIRNFCIVAHIDHGQINFGGQAYSKDRPFNRAWNARTGSW